MVRRRSRRELMATAGAGAGAALALAGVAGCGGTDPSPPSRRDDRPADAGDLAILRFALSLEYFANDFYERLLSEQVLEGEDADVVTGVREDEEAHVRRLEELVDRLGGRRPDRPLPDFEKLLDGTSEAVLVRAAEIEDLGAAAYLGQIARVKQRAVRDALLAIHSVEGRHAAGLGHRAGRPFAPEGAVARPLDAAEVRARLTDFTL